jgi:hypothetical protein
MKNIFYVYIYLDPRKPGKYYYPGIETTFLFEPFYVGKGSKYRLNKHLNSVQSGSKHVFNSFKVGKIKHILKEGLMPYIMILTDNLSEKDAFNLEKDTIKNIGRSDLKKGPLCNFTDGGEGSSGRKLSKKTKDKIREKALGRKASELTKEKMRNNNSGENNPMYGKKSAMNGKKHSRKSIKKMQISKPDLGNKIKLFYKKNSKNLVKINGIIQRDSISMIEASELTGVKYHDIFNGVNRKSNYIKNGFIFSKIA